MRLVCAFTDSPPPPLAEVGGKGMSLIRMAQAELTVPPGFVLTVAFFDPWFARLQALPEWQAFRQAGDGDLKARCDALKARATDLTFTAEQRAAVEKALAGQEPGALFAVRSSSPEEDLEGSSFAGGYETVLGVTAAGAEAAVRRAFASCLDVRVAVYKREHGFDPYRPRIAVVVQRQIASEVAGVGFSLNPITNDYDEAVFNANWGLGETVVAGLASPDLFTVDKVRRRIIDRQIGSKETSIWLTPSGGTEQREDPRHDQPSLTDEQVLALTDELTRIDKLYGKPMDIEWAFERGRLYLLQARPITTHLALPEDLVTPPGERKRLYFDITISVQGLFKPMSALGTSILSAFISFGTRRLFGKDYSQDIATTVIFARHGRLYLNASKAMGVVGKERIVTVMPNADPIAASAMRTVSEEEYRAHPRRLPFWHLPRVLPVILRVRRALRSPEQARDRGQQAMQEHLAYIRGVSWASRPLDGLVKELLEHTFGLILGHIMPGFVASKIAAFRLRRVLPNPSEEERRLIDKLDQSLPGNVTVEMGLAMAALAKLVPPHDSVNALQERLAEGKLPAEFTGAWKSFLDRYGHRGPGELDTLSPRYREQPAMLLGQILQLASAPDAASPQAIYERSQRERHEAFEALCKVADRHGRSVGRRFRALYRVVEAIGGWRETPKYFMVQVIDIVRSRARAEAEKLVAAGRLDRPEQVFDLLLGDLVKGLADPSVDLRALAATRSAPIERLARFKELPRLVDSRGRIIRPPPRPLKAGELAGHPVSAGVARGPVKVLHTPDEKPLLPGDILVARATDPGWTPLFVNAAAVVLEVGGVMQHGALVAREYGKPCVAGVLGATERLRDGTIVEVDGAAGVVRLP